MSLFDTFTMRQPPSGALKRRFDAWFRRRPIGRVRPGRLLLLLAVALVLAGIAHIVSILTMPALAERNAFARLSEHLPPNEMTLLPDVTPDTAMLPMMDPAFVTAVCLYDLSDKPLKVRVPATADYTSVSFFTDGGLAFYAVSDQVTGKMVELDLMTSAQRASLPEDEDITAADWLVIESPARRGIVLVRAHARVEGMRALVRRQLEAATCGSNGGSIAPLPAAQ